MKKERALLYNVLVDPNQQINLNNYNELAEEKGLIEKIYPIIDVYNSKHATQYFNYSTNTNTFIKNNPLISPLLKVIRSLDDTDFEKLSAIVCKCLGWESEVATQPSHDQGIDFIAEKNLLNIRVTRVEYVFGQSKHHAETLVNTSEIRELSGSVEFLKERIFSNKNDMYKDYSVKKFTPVRVIFITSYFFSSPANNLCEESDILNLDIVDVICICLNSICDGTIDWLDAYKNLDSKKIFADLNGVNVVK